MNKIILRGIVEAIGGKGNACEALVVTGERVVTIAMSIGVTVEWRDGRAVGK